MKASHLMAAGLGLLTIFSILISVGFLIAVAVAVFATSGSLAPAPQNCPGGVCPPPAQQYNWTTTPELGPEPNYYGPPGGG